MALLNAVVANGFVWVEETGVAVETDRPPARFVPGNRDGAVVEGLGFVDQLRDVDVMDLSSSLALETHAAGDTEACRVLCAIGFGEVPAPDAEAMLKEYACGESIRGWANLL